MDVNELVTSISERVRESANVKAVFGDPINMTGGVTIIPVAVIKISGGGGGKRELEKSEGDEAGEQESGLGLGLKVASKPLGYIKVKNGDAKFVATADATKIAIASMGAISIIMLSAGKLIRFKMWRKKKRGRHMGWHYAHHH